MAQSNIQKLIENELKFREINEAVQKGFEQLEQIAFEHGAEADVTRPNDAVYFYCECSDENCRLRILLTMDTYTHIHKNRRYFVLVCGHEILTVERVIEKKDDYCIVEKRVDPSETVGHMHKTNIVNV